MKKIKEEEDGWSKNIFPVMKNYRMACCDCGLTHDFQFGVAKILSSKDGAFVYEDLDPVKYRVLFKARRNRRSTANLRRKKK
jgi:hypothetical protein